MATSAMPNFSDKLTAQEMADVVSYLGTMKTPVPAGAGGGGRGAVEVVLRASGRAGGGGGL